MTVQSIIQTPDFYKIGLPNVERRGPEEFPSDSDVAELSPQAVAAQEQNRIGVAHSLPGLQDSESASTEGQTVRDLHVIVPGSDNDETESDHDDGDPRSAEATAISTSDSEEGEDDPVVEEPSAKSTTGETLSDEERKEVEGLRERDREVRAHEQAHASTGGSYIRGGIQYEYQTGPDGRRYAVGGEVSIDTSPVSGDPQKTIQKAQQVRRAAMAPAEPSGADRQAAAAASRMEAEARQELIEDGASPEESRDNGGEAASVTTESVSGDPDDSKSDIPELEARPATEQGLVRQNKADGSVDSSDPGLRGIEVSNASSNRSVASLAPEPEPVESASSGLDDLIQDIQERAESGGGAAAVSVVSLSHGTGTSAVGGLIDLIT